MNSIEQEIVSRIKKNGFVCPNESGLYEIDHKDLFSAIYSLINKGVIKRRNCDGLAYEFLV